ncbi:hypothetical protein AMS68_001195 [Peltaster fructicola]|uniref:Nephrocystin 3-like N-terminal domain-containing protein n=1 Tax=Peltaster fructicola TaxID=286661 RepID=A0A6H0XM31_9PEZI|nr:hypothetical protein AMS68_001195 [Peltaster fructicola]
MSAAYDPFPRLWECTYNGLPLTDQVTLRSARSFRRNIAQIIIRWAEEQASEAAMLGERLYLSDGGTFVIAKDVLDKVSRFVRDIEQARHTWRHPQTEHVDEFLDYCLHIITGSSLGDSMGADNLVAVADLLRLFWLLETCRHNATITEKTHAEDAHNLTLLYKHVLLSRIALIISSLSPVPAWTLTSKNKGTKKPKGKGKGKNSKIKGKTKTPPAPSEDDSALSLLLEQIKSCCCRIPSVTGRSADCCCNISSPGLLYRPSNSQDEAFVDSDASITTPLSIWLGGNSAHNDTGLLQDRQYDYTTKKSVQWLYGMKTFEHWASVSRSALLHLHGPIGCGKTYAVVDIIRSLRATESDGPYVGFCFCNNFMTSRDKPTAQTVFSSMLDSFLKRSGESGKIHRAMLNYWSHIKARIGAQSSKRARLSDCLNVMLEMLHYGPMILVVDAVDELEAEEQDLLIRKLEHVTFEAKNVLKILVTSRGDAATCNALPMAYDLPTEHCPQLPHVRRYAQDQLSEIIKNTPPTLDDSYHLLEQEYVEMLSSHGSFLQTRLQMLLLQRDPIRNFEAQVQSMKSATSLVSTYMHIYGRILAQDEASVSVALATLCWLLYGGITNKAKLLRLVSMTTTRCDLSIKLLDQVCLGLISFVGSPSLVHGSALKFLRQQYRLAPSRVLPQLAMSCLEACSGSNNKMVPVEIYAYAVSNAAVLCGLADEYHDPALLSQLTHYLRYGLPNSKLGSEIAIVFPDLHTPLLVAASYGLITILETWQWSTDDLQVTTQYRESALHLACRAGHTAATSFLLRMGCDVNAKTDSNETPLVYASAAGHVQVCRMLLDHGLKLNWTDSTTLEAYKQSCHFGKEQVSLLLLQRTDGLTEALPQLWDITIDADSESLLASLLSYGTIALPIDTLLSNPANGSSRAHTPEVLTNKQCLSLAMHSSSYGYTLTTAWLLQRLIDVGYLDHVIDVLQNSVLAGYRYLYLAPMHSGLPYTGLASSAKVVRRVFALARSGHRSELLRALLQLSINPADSQNPTAVFRTAIACGDLETADVFRKAGECVYSNETNAFNVALRGCHPSNIFTALELYSRYDTHILGHDQSSGPLQPPHNAPVNDFERLLNELVSQASPPQIHSLSHCETGYHSDTMPSRGSSFEKA